MLCYHSGFKLDVFGHVVELCTLGKSDSHLRVDASGLFVHVLLVDLFQLGVTILGEDL
jgi:hypothetical protein